MATPIRVSPRRSRQEPTPMQDEAPASEIMEAAGDVSDALEEILPDAEEFLTFVAENGAPLVTEHGRPLAAQLELPLPLPVHEVVEEPEIDEALLPVHVQREREAGRAAIARAKAQFGMEVQMGRQLREEAEARLAHNDK